MSGTFDVNSPESFGLFQGDKGYASFDTDFPQGGHEPETYADDPLAYGSRVAPNGNTITITNSSEE
jgi:hypothetical protein